VILCLFLLFLMHLLTEGHNLREFNGVCRLGSFVVEL